MRVLIIGGVAAGTKTAAKLKREDRSAEVTVITKDDEIKVKYSDKKLKLICPKKRNYYSVLKEKLKWGDNLC